MPARSNDFQRLVRAIQGHLSRQGTVTESRFLTDKDTGSLVEVDIVIEETVGGHAVLVGVECTARARRATVEWYREMRGKHADLPIAKTVLVSKSGFTQDIYEKARKDNITLLTLEEAHTFKWQALFEKLKGGTVAEVEFSLREVTLKAHDDLDNLSLQSITPDTPLQGLGIERPLGQLVMEVALHTGLTRQIMSQLGSVLKKSDHFSFGFRLPEGTCAVLEDHRVQVAEITATLTIHPRFRSVNWRPLDFNGQTVATGTFPADFLFPGAEGDTVVTVSHESNASMKMSLLAPSDKDIELDVYPHALWTEPADLDPTTK